VDLVDRVLMVMTYARTPPTAALLSFADEVGDVQKGPVTVQGAGNHWHFGGSLDVGTRTVCAPAGIVQFEPDEMLIRCGAGTAFTELREALDPKNQCVPLDPANAGSTVGGLLAAGLSGHRRLRFGAARDLLLEAQFVTASGELLRAGAPVVKNVSGYDLCRLLVGSFGTVGLMGEVVLRCRPKPLRSRWYQFDSVEAERVQAIRTLSFNPSSVLWNGDTAWLLNEGHPDDLRAEHSKLMAVGGQELSAGPVLPETGRLSIDPARIGASKPAWDALGTWVAEVGVGTVHTSWLPLRRSSPTPLEVAIKANLDPTRRLSPGRLEL
jgi:FAD/FMN-containing dehydrogenase